MTQTRRPGDPLGQQADVSTAPPDRLGGLPRAALAIAAVVAIVVTAATLTRWLMPVVVPAHAPALDLGALPSLGLMQALLVVFTLAVARLFGPWHRSLALRPLPEDRAVLVKAAAVVTLSLGLYTAGALIWFRDQILTDLHLFKPMIEAGGLPLAILVLGFGAPLSEELLFRGFLLGELARTRLGIFGASLVSTLGWTALHLGYGPVGLVEVFLAGLLMSWALWISGSIWVPFILHAIYNLVVLAVLLTVGS